MKIRLALILVSLGMAAQALASEKEDVKTGNLLYNTANYGQAAKSYQRALSDKPDSAVAVFNLGAVRYKEGSFAGAVELFNKAIASGEETLIPKADYNIGNSQYRLGSKITSTEKEEIKKVKEIYETALKYYKRAMDLDPGDHDAKFNYEFVSKKLNELRETYNFKKQDEKKDKNKDQQQNQQQQQQNQQQQQDKDKQQEQQQGGGQQQDKKDQQQGQQQSNQKQQQQQQQEDRDKQQEQQQGGGQQQDKKDKDQGEGGGEGQDQQPKPEKKEGEDEKSEPEKGESDKRKPEEGSGDDEQPKDRAQEDNMAQAAQEPEPAKGQESPAAGGEEDEEKPKPEEQQGGLAAYQSAQQDVSAGAGEMTEQEAKMLLEGYKGEEVTGKAIKMRRKPVDMPEPLKDW